jgi:transcriptional regulator with XRE-family HTH domain
MDLAHEIGVSPRHLSFVETGRSKPSPELVLALAEGLDVPLRERNTLLLAAGYAPRYAERAMEDPAMDSVRSSLERMLAAHEPFPGVVIDRAWNVVLANRAASALVEGLADHVLGPTLNVYRVCLHPDGLAARTRNLDEWADYLLRTLRRSVVLTGDPALQAMLDEVSGYPNIVDLVAEPASTGWDEPPLLVPLEVTLGGQDLSLFTTLTTFGTPRDVTLDELAVELFFPADDATRAALLAR